VARERLAADPLAGQPMADRRHRAATRKETAPDPGTGRFPRNGPEDAAGGGVVVWFGALKLIGSSPVHELIAATLPFVDADLSMPVLGVVGIVLGPALAAGVVPRITVLVLCGH
jgi:hypothetical protein